MNVQIAHLLIVVISILSGASTAIGLRYYAKLQVKDGEPAPFSLLHDAIFAFALTLMAITASYTLLHGPKGLNDTLLTTNLMLYGFRLVSEIVTVVSLYIRKWMHPFGVLIGLSSVLTLYSFVTFVVQYAQQ